jgi:hypothetical protein
MNDVKEAAERLRRNAEGEHLTDIYRDFKLPVEQYMKDKLETSKAYLTEHPADDGEAITEDWLRSVGFEFSYLNKHLWIKSGKTGHLRHTSMAMNVNSQLWFLNGLGCANCETRGDVRRLALALGIELQETK